MNNNDNNLPFAQGDLLFVPLGDNVDMSKIVYDKTKPPVEARSRVAHDHDKLIVGHSETGHHHYIPAGPDYVQLFGTSVPEVALLQVKQQVVLKHDRTVAQHGEIVFPAGNYAVLKQKEQRPEGWVRVVD